MVVVPQGRFTMGAPAGEEERANWPIERRGLSVPQHLVTIRHKLAIAKFDVTRDEYAQFVAETNRPDPDSCITVNASGTGFIATNGNWHSPGFPQTGRDPVVCVSWDDAQAKSTELKQRFYKALADHLHEGVKIRKEDVLINFVEVPKENWSFGNGGAQYVTPPK
jgi:formylglycine-generating enzyme required for sulfatase activity